MFGESMRTCERAAWEIFAAQQINFLGACLIEKHNNYCERSLKPRHQNTRPILKILLWGRITKTEEAQAIFFGHRLGGDGLNRQNI